MVVSIDWVPQNTTVFLWDPQKRSHYLGKAVEWETPVLMVANLFWPTHESAPGLSSEFRVQGLGRQDLGLNCFRDKPFFSPVFLILHPALYSAAYVA